MNTPSWRVLLSYALISGINATQPLNAQCIDEIEGTDSQYSFDPDNGHTIGTDTCGLGHLGILNGDSIRKTYHPLQNGGLQWQAKQTDETVDNLTVIPYQGDLVWNSVIEPDSASLLNGRSENIICRKIRFNTGEHYFKFAVNLMNADSVISADDAFLIVAQLWQASSGKPPVFLGITKHKKFELVKRDFVNDDPNGEDDERITLWRASADTEVNRWYHFMLKIKLGRNSDGKIELHMMDNDTGEWVSKYSNNALDDVGKAVQPSAPNPEFKFKLGGYVGPETVRWSALYDSIGYANSYSLLTRNALIGHCKAILNVGHNNSDSSSRSNHLTNHGNANWNGTWLELDGSGDYASMNVPTTNSNGLADFDVGNYVRVEAKFQVNAAPNGTAGVFYAGGENKEAYGILIPQALDRFQFAVGHPDGSSTWMSIDEPVVTGKSYRAIATYNRFGDAAFSIENLTDNILYEATFQHDGLPLTTPDRIWIGRRKSYYFDGRIDSIKVYNNVAAE